MVVVVMAVTMVVACDNDGDMRRYDVLVELGDGRLRPRAHDVERAHGGDQHVERALVLLELLKRQSHRRHAKRPEVMAWGWR